MRGQSKSFANEMLMRNLHLPLLWAVTSAGHPHTTRPQKGKAAPSQGWAHKDLKQPSSLKAHSWEKPPKAQQHTCTLPIEHSFYFNCRCLLSSPNPAATSGDRVIALKCSGISHWRILLRALGFWGQVLLVDVVRGVHSLWRSFLGSNMVCVTDSRAHRAVLWDRCVLRPDWGVVLCSLGCVQHCDWVRSAVSHFLNKVTISEPLVLWNIYRGGLSEQVAEKSFYARWKAVKIGPLGNGCYVVLKDVW